MLSTYNGSKYLKEQLDSLQNQTYKNFEIIARDDGSSDNTLEILKAYDVKLMDAGKNLGAKGSFTELLSYATANSEAEYFMFCDQDDVWKSDKIEKTIVKMQEMEQEFGVVPLLVHTDLEVVDEKLNTISGSFLGFQKLNPAKNNFNNLLMQNVITGCTVMLNKELAKKCLYMPNEAIMHDWWIGLAASYFGKIGYVQEATIKYRQHTSNTIGAKEFNIAFILEKIFKKIRVEENAAQAKAFLQYFEKELDEGAKKMLREFAYIQTKSFWQKRVILWKYRLLKNGFMRNAGLFLKV